jgi:hypothetical protein
VVTELTNLEHLAIYVPSLFLFSIPILHALAPDRRKTRRNRRNKNSAHREELGSLGAYRSCSLIGQLTPWLKWTAGSPTARALPFCSAGAACLLLALSCATARAVTATHLLSIDGTSITFGQVTVKDPSTQSLILKSTGTASVTITSAAVSGTGFSISGMSFPKTLNPGQSATLEVEFDPAAAGSASGKLVVVSNSSYGTATVVLKGTGVAASGYQVNLSWDAPGSSKTEIAGYRIYRATSGSSAYQQLNPALDTSTSYADTTVKASTTYDYYVESVSTSGTSSAPSGVLSIAVP